jgi:hypothetical protein
LCESEQKKRIREKGKKGRREEGNEERPGNWRIDDVVK